MHKYLRAIGFSQLETKKELQELIKKSIIVASGREYAKKNQHSTDIEYKREVAPSIGIIIRGEFDSENMFVYSHYLPYLRGNYISSKEDITIERHMEKETFAGVCDDIKVGVTMIFYLQNTIPYLRRKYGNRLPAKDTRLVLSALSVEGIIMMPLEKNKIGKHIVNKALENRIKLIQEAREGNEEAIEILTLEDIETYSTISRKMRKDDVFTLVDTYFMPYGVECDQYSILGEIMDFRKEINILSKEEVYIITLNCNDILLDMCINVIDLVGEPEKGRRFRGIIWLQGEIEYSDTKLEQ
ncbi:MAG: DUF3881 family protein [Eubacteriales bacterium]